MKYSFPNKKPKYIELFDHIAEQINSGALKANEKLPSKRNLSIDLNISLNTVINAYNLLLDEGYIYSVEKRGYFVCEQLVVTKKIESVKLCNQSYNDYLYDFTTSNVLDFPKTNWKRIIKNLLEQNEYLNKPGLLGDIELRMEISKHLEKNRGIKSNYNQIIIGSGIEMLENIIKCINIDNITLENPGYHKLGKIALNCNKNINYIPVDEQGALVPKNTTVLYATPFNQFPTGIKMSIARKKEIANFLTSTNSYLIEDDFDAEFRINSNPTTALYSINNERVIFFSSFSTTLYPGLRISYAILPTDILDTYTTLYSSYSCSVPMLNQLALKEFIKEGYYASHVNKRKKLYIEKRAKCIEILNKYNIEFDEKRNYLSLLIKCNKDIDDNIINKLKENKINIQPLSTFYSNNQKSNCLILGYTAIKLDDIEKGLELLIKIINEK